MNKVYTYFFAFILLCSSIVADAQIIRPMGTNLTSITDYSTEFVFMDVFEQSREWIPHGVASGSDWSSGVSIPKDANGYPLEIPYDDGTNPSQGIRTLMYFGDLEGLYPSGKYRLVVLGEGEIRLWGAASGTFTCPIDTLVDVDNTLGGIAMEIEKSLAANHITNIKFLRPDFKTTFPYNPFNPKFIEFIEDFQMIRFMDWMVTNNSTNTNWEDRNLLTDYNQSRGNGVAYEHIINLCNLTKKDAWICVPHKATDAYVLEMAKLFKSSLDPELKLYVEYSNEVWNGIFTQNHYAEDMGDALGYSGQAWEKGWKFYAKRTADVLNIFETEFNDSNRLVKVIASQAGNSWVSNFILERFSETKFNPSGVKADVLAIAPYFGGELADKLGDDGLATSITVDQIVDSLQASLKASYGYMVGAKTVANDHGLELITYEGGQHLVSYRHTDNLAFVDKLTEANRQAKMEDIYCEYFNYWYDSAQLNMFCHFSSHGNYSQYGSWGVKETMDDTVSPKYLGLKNCVFSYNSETASVGDIASADVGITIYPVPSHDGLIHIKQSSVIARVQVTDNLGKEVDCKVHEKSDGNVLVDVDGFRGLALVTIIRENGSFVSKKVIFLD